MWLIVPRKLLPTPLRTIKPNPTPIVLPVLSWLIVALVLSGVYIAVVERGFRAILFHW